MLSMILIGGGAAILEARRAAQFRADPDVNALRQQQAELKRALEAVQRELSAEKEQRQQAQGAADDLSAVNADLQAKASSLKAQRDALEDQSKLLLRRFAALEESAAGLQTSNDDLAQQVEALRLESEAEVAKTSEQVDALKREVASAMQSWSDGDTDAAAFLSKMAELGVEVRCAAGELPALDAPSQITPTDQLQLSMDSSWTSKMQLVTDSRDRMSRLLTAAAARQGGRPPLAAAALTFPSAKTPPRDAGMSRRLEMAGFSVSGLTPRGSRSDSQALLQDAASVPQPQAQPKADAPKKQPLQAIENVAPNASSGAALPKAKGDKKVRQGKGSMPKLQFAALDFDSEDVFSRDLAVRR